MKSPPNRHRRWIVWGLLLSLTFVLTVMVWMDDADSGPDAANGNKKPKHALRVPSEAGVEQKPVAESSTAALLEQSVERLELPLLNRTAASDATGTEATLAPPVDLLATRSWIVPPPPPPVVAPKAPPLPFKLVGRLIENNQQVVFLANQDRNYIAREGAKLDNNYLVERIEPGRMTLIYLPLDERQILNLGAVN